MTEHLLLQELLGLKIRDVRELLGVDTDLNLKAVNGTFIPYQGWVEARFRLNSEKEKRSYCPFFGYQRRIGTPNYWLQRYRITCEGQ